MSESKKYPKLLQQYIDIQKKYPDSIVAMEIGSFFEILQTDGIGYAQEAAQLLDLVLTSKNKGDPEAPLLCGFPVISSQTHFNRLVQAGRTVVVVSQSVRGKRSDDNKNVRREISQILSPGTIIDNIGNEKSNYFAALYFQENDVGIALIDVSTGEVLISEMKTEMLSDFLEIKNPSEILTVGDIGNFVLKRKEHQILHNVTNSINKLNSTGEILAKIYNLSNPTSNPTASLIHLGIEMWKLGSLALANLLNYLTDYNSLLLKRVGQPTIYSLSEHMVLPHNAFVSLDVFRTQTGKEDARDTFIGVIDRCKTAMGQRKLRQWVQGPLNDVSQINARLNAVERFIKTNDFLPELKNVYDFSRLSRKMTISRLMPHEIVNFYNSLKISQSVLKKHKQNKLSDKAQKIISYIDKCININEAESLSEFTIDFFQLNYDSELAEIHDKWQNEDIELNKLKTKFEDILDAKGKLKINEKLESFTLTGPKSLAQSAKNKDVAIQVKASDVQIVDEDWIERSKICLHYKHRFLAKAQDVWSTFQSEFIQEFGEQIIEVSDKISELDVLSNFALISKERNYVKPVFTNHNQAYVSFKNLRHPVIELSNRLTEGFVSNDVCLGEDKKTLVIYGANSAGKSTILKSVALNIILAQMGCFIAASEGSALSVFDSIQTRITSFDSISDGLSTFTLEMFELQSALKFKNRKSIFLFDEIGRGTSVEDGEAIAYGTLAFLENDANKAITLFATHYHSLVPEIAKLTSVEIKNVSCFTDKDGELIFSRKLENGPGNGSYGVEVAKSCGIPEEIIRIASRYNQNHFKLKTSRYNKALSSTLCENCRESPFQQTHHIVEQKQGRVKNIVVDGETKKINDKSNLVLLCATCHELVTRGEITILKKFKTTGNHYFLEVRKNDKS